MLEGGAARAGLVSPRAWVAATPVLSSVLEPPALFGIPVACIEHLSARMQTMGRRRLVNIRWFVLCV